MASVLIKPTKRLDAIETPITPCRYSQPTMRLRKIGIIEPEGSKWEYQCVKFVLWITFFEIWFALFDSFAIVNSYIAWKNHILKGKPKKHRAYKKYRAGSSFGVDRKMGQACYASLQGTTASCKKNEGVWYFLFRKLLWSRVTIEHKANPIRPESKHHDEPIELPLKSVRSFVICGKPIKWHCWVCTEDIGGIFPVCPTSVRPCNTELHRTRREIYLNLFAR